MSEQKRSVNNSKFETQVTEKLETVKGGIKQLKSRLKAVPKDALAAHEKMTMGYGKVREKATTGKSRVKEKVLQNVSETKQSIDHCDERIVEQKNEGQQKVQTSLAEIKESLYHAKAVMIEQSNAFEDKVRSTNSKVSADLHETKAKVEKKIDEKRHAIELAKLTKKVEFSEKMAEQQLLKTMCAMSEVEPAYIKALEARAELERYVATQ